MHHTFKQKISTYLQKNFNSALLNINKLVGFLLKKFLQTIGASIVKILVQKVVEHKFANKK